ncbi:pollen-specific leucine-rich repeat extensin-like protein 4 [Iris pallida]|uniref:Pollen-specific leucine-rich repeat extensin-like protein 4 n=1 Tax=Iris pallida TaxID=29817 RepID=A0AAX6EDN9_IRIPA|nr:pollen-specific leucine-rich repeat extensin-like protein 4 [Iris pallida]
MVETGGLVVVMEVQAVVGIGGRSGDGGDLGGCGDSDSDGGRDDNDSDGSGMAKEAEGRSRGRIGCRSLEHGWSGLGKGCDREGLVVWTGDGSEVVAGCQRRSSAGHWPAEVGWPDIIERGN